MRTVKFASLVIAASAVLFACKPKEETPVAAEGASEGATQEEAAPAAATVDRREACNLTLSARNLPSAKWIAPEGLNVYDILDHSTLSNIGLDRATS